jgi:hypothetical protein
MEVAVAVVTQHDQIALTFEADALVCSMMHLEPIAPGAQIADMSGLVERQRADALPVRRLQVLGVRQMTQIRNHTLHRPVDLA